MSSRPRVALFGGTFDPVHQGHLEIAAKAARELDLDSVVFIPCRRSPHKDKAPGASDADRLAMLRLATAFLPAAQVDDFELRKPPPSYTSETVAHYLDQLPPDTWLHLLIGQDQWESLPRWHEVDFLREHLTFIVVGRDGQPAPRPGFRTCFLHGDHPASASRIRNDLREGFPPRWLPPPVRDYVQTHGLYLSTT